MKCSSSRHPVLPIAATALCFAVVLGPRTAEACSAQSWLELLRPSAGDVHPAGGGLLFYRRLDAPIELFAVTVDGEPATLAFDGTYSIQGEIESYAIGRIEPPPQEGEVVTVSQCSWDGELQHQICPRGGTFEPLFEFTSGPPDTSAPPQAGDVSLTHELGTFEYVCEDVVGTMFHVRATDLDQGDETDVLYVVQVRDAGGAVVSERAFHIDEPDADLNVDAVLPDAPDDVAEYCAAVTALDLSGNAVAVAERCGSVDVTPETTGSSGDDPSTTGTTVGENTEGDDEPASTGEDSATEPTTDATGGASEGQTISDRGCACRSDRTGETTAGFVGLLLCFWRRREKRSPRRFVGWRTL